jgi:hypothetical protein
MIKFSDKANLVTKLTNTKALQPSTYWDDVLSLDYYDTSSGLSISDQLYTARGS